MERILEAAIKHLPTAEVVTGRNHWECMKKWRKLYPHLADELKTRNIIQGFVTESMNYVDRETAAKIALECGQIKELKYHRTELFSEELY